MVFLRYRSHLDIEELVEGECTVHRASGSGPLSWWQLWFCVRRATDNALEIFSVPVAPRETYTEEGPGGRTWGLTQTGQTTWQVAPSINVLDDRDAALGTHDQPSLWHETPTIVDVPESERWTL